MSVDRQPVMLSHIALSLCLHASRSATGKLQCETNYIGFACVSLEYDSATNHVPCRVCIAVKVAAHLQFLNSSARQHWNEGQHKKAKIAHAQWLLLSAGQADLAHAIEFVGKPVESVSITVDWPAHATAESMADSSAEVAGEHVYIDVPGCKALDVQLPFAVTAEGAVMQQARGNQQLQLRLKYLPCRQLVEQVRICCNTYVICHKLSSVVGRVCCMRSRIPAVQRFDCAHCHADITAQTLALIVMQTSQHRFLHSCQVFMTTPYWKAAMMRLVLSPSNSVALLVRCLH